MHSHYEVARGYEVVGGSGRREETVERNDAAGTSPPTFSCDHRSLGYLMKKRLFIGFLLIIIIIEKQNNNNNKLDH